MNRFLLSTAFSLAALAAGCSGSSMSAPHALPTGAATPAVGILNTLHTQTTIGSTVVNGDQNPYGLAIAPVSAGKITAGDLIVCNFNDPANVQGTGTTIVGLHPVAGATPYLIAQNAQLDWCAALTLDGSDRIYTADYSANDDLVFSPAGTLTSTITTVAWNGAFGELYAPTAGPFGSASVFATSVNAGTVVRLDLMNGSVVSGETIVAGFTKNTGQPGSLWGASGLTYDPNGDQLYVVDGNANRLYAFRGASSIPANGVTVAGTSFGGPAAANARLVASGAPMNLPISAALLENGNVVVGNTGDNNVLEYSPAGVLLGEKLVDAGATGAIFGMVATGTAPANQKIYFNDDNTSAVVLISQ